MKFPKWLGGVLLFIGGVAAAILAGLLGRGRGPTQADVIVTTADAEKKKIADEIKADSDAALAARFNKLGGKG